MSAYETIVNECRLATTITIENEVYTNELYSTYTFNLVIDDCMVIRHMYYGRYSDSDADDLDCLRSRRRGFSILRDVLLGLGFKLDAAASEAFANGLVDTIKVGR